jgi:hypothetical protein
MNERDEGRRSAARLLTSKARLHFQSIAILNYLDRAEWHATAEQFAAAAKIAARTLLLARNRSR